MRANSTQESCLAAALYVVVASPPVLGSTELIPGPRPLYRTDSMPLVTASRDVWQVAGLCFL